MLHTMKGKKHWISIGIGTIVYILCDLESEMSSQVAKFVDEHKIIQDNEKTSRL